MEDNNKMIADPRAPKRAFFICSLFAKLFKTYKLAISHTGLMLKFALY